MNGTKVKKKPTIRELTNVVLEINNRTNTLYNMIIDLEKAFSLYIDMNKDTKKFNVFIDKRIKEWKEKQNDSSKNEVPDKPNLQRDTDGEGTGTERVRKKTG